jgi:hypothetical protein
MHLKNRLCDVEADRRDCLHDELLRIVAASSATDSKALARPVGGAVHSITSGHARTIRQGEHVSFCIVANRTAPASAIRHVPPIASRYRDAEETRINGEFL